MTIAIRVDHNLKQWRRKLSDFQRRQIPFAMSQALNDTAFDVRRHIVDRIWPNSFPRAANKRFPNVAFRVKKATKRNLESVVFDRLKRDWLMLHIRGGTKRPWTSRNLAVPVGVKRTATGRISAAKSPRNLQNSFIGEGGTAIFQRVGGKRQRRIKMMYALTPTAQIDRVFPFFRQARLKVDQVFPRHFARRFKKALATAR